MKLIIVLCVLLATLIVANVDLSLAAEAEFCKPEQCERPKDCICSSLESPLETAKTPQFVVLSFDDAASRLIYDNYLSKLLFNRYNPDGNHIGASFYVPHEYTDYEVVNLLYKQGFEIAVNSISKSASIGYWSTASKDLLVQEFGGQRTILSHFANISSDKIGGVRTPDFQINGNISIAAYEESGLRYDSSWPTIDRYFPYTLDYLSTQECNIGKCPTESFPGFYVSPIQNLRSMSGTPCITLLGCNARGSVDQITSWLKDNFANTYNNNRAPLNLLVNSAWFTIAGNSFTALNQFLDYLAELEDVFIVANSEVIRWAGDPKPLGEYVSPSISSEVTCNKVTCPLKHNGETRYMVSCVACPKVYPWVGNPLGQD